MLGFTEETLLPQLNDYLFNRLYNCDFVDIAPFALARALNYNIMVLDTDTRGSFTESVFSPTEPTFDTIAIHRRGEHYNGIGCVIAAPPLFPSINTVSMCSTDNTCQASQQKISYDRSTLQAIRGSIACPVTRKLRKNLFHNHVWGQHHGCPQSVCRAHDCPKIPSRQIQVRVESRSEIMRNETGITWANLVVLVDSCPVADSNICQGPSYDPPGLAVDPP